VEFVAHLSLACAGDLQLGEIEFAYVDGSAFGTPYVEIARGVGPVMREFYGAVRTKGEQ
jgi:hypothetical protein